MLLNYLFCLVLFFGFCVQLKDKNLDNELQTAVKNMKLGKDQLDLYYKIKDLVEFLKNTKQADFTKKAKVNVSNDSAKEQEDEENEVKESESPVSKPSNTKLIFIVVGSCVGAVAVLAMLIGVYLYRNSKRNKKQSRIKSFRELINVSI